MSRPRRCAPPLAEAGDGATEENPPVGFARCAAGPQRVVGGVDEAFRMGHEAQNLSRGVGQAGNAVDAAVAVGFALAVTHPEAGNIGGGGFMLVHLNKAGRTVAIDYREVAPRAARRDMFLDEKGEVVPRRSQLTHLASGVPGSVAGLLHALERYGRLDRATVMAPAIRPTLTRATARVLMLKFFIVFVLSLLHPRFAECCLQEGRKANYPALRLLLL